MVCREGVCAGDPSATDAKAASFRLTIRKALGGLGWGMIGLSGWFFLLSIVLAISLPQAKNKRGWQKTCTTVILNLRRCRSEAILQRLDEGSLYFREIETMLMAAPQILKPVQDDVLPGLRLTLFEKKVVGVSPPFKGFVLGVFILCFKGDPSATDAKAASVRLTIRMPQDDIGVGLWGFFDGSLPVVNLFRL